MRQAETRGRFFRLALRIRTNGQKNRPCVCVDFEGHRYDTGNLRGFLEATIDFALDHPETGAWLKTFLKDKAKKL